MFVSNFPTAIETALNDFVQALRTHAREAELAMSEPKALAVVQDLMGKLKTIHALYPSGVVEAETPATE